MGRNSKDRIEPSFGAPQRSANRSTARGQANPRSKKKPNKKQAKNNSSLWWRFFKFSTYWTFVLGIWGTIGVAVIFGFYAIQLPSTSTWAVPDRPPNAKIISTNGTLIANRGATGGQNTSLDQMSPYIPMAVIAIEDRRFHSHFGIDPIGLTRAMITNVTKGRFAQGGSTLTQQLAKNLFLEPKRTIGRKVQEAILAIWLESKFTKDEIIELYLNRVYFGSGAHGVDAASRRYFGKSARDVNLAEAAILAGLLKAPSRLSPARNPEGARKRSQLVLAAMQRTGSITKSEAKKAVSMKAKKAKRYWSGSQHYVADIVMKELPNLIGENHVDVIVDTTIDFKMQKHAGSIIGDTLSRKGKKLKVSQGAMVALDGTGAVRALVGGREYSDSQFNRAVDAKRQPGSAFKPIVYLTALEAGKTPETVRLDKPFLVGKWRPENYDRKFRGPVTLGEALSKSLNTIAAQMVMEVGPKAVVETAARLGIKTKLARNASIALGTSEVSLIELTGAYAPFANGGYRVDPYIIKRVTTLEGKVLYERNAPANPKVVGSRELGMMNQMLRRTVEEGTGKAARVKNWQVAGKTGTTQNSRDALFIGYSANLIAGFWYGNDDGSPTNKVTGGSIPAKSFATFMTAALDGKPIAELPGYYLPKSVSMVPAPRPSRAGDKLAPMNDPLRKIIRSNDDNPQIARQAGERLRRPLSSVQNDGVPIPQGTIGGGNNKPRSILDLLMGK